MSNDWLFIKIQDNKNPLIVGLVYFSPSKDYIHIHELFHFTLAKILDQYQTYPLFVGGDFNARVGELNKGIDYIFEETLLKSKRRSKDKIINSKGRNLCEKMENLGLSIINGRSISDNPAQFTLINHLGKSVIDYLWCNNHALYLIKDFHISDRILLLDHLPICLQLNVRYNIHNPPKEQNNTQTIPSHRTRLNINPDTLRKFHSNLTLQYNKINTQNPQSFINLPNSIKKEAITSQLIQVKLKKHPSKSKNKPWFNSFCGKLKREVRSAYRKFKNKNCNPSYQLYNQKKRQYTITIRQTKRTYENNIKRKIDNIHNPTEFWKTIRQIRPIKTYESPISLKRWTDFYKKLFGPATPDGKTFYDVGFPFLDDPITLRELQQTVNKLKNNKACGPDNIPNEICKILPTPALNHILLFFNNIMHTEKCPPDFCLSKITMLYKKGDPNNESNYRGIALLNTLFKTFTSILSKRLNTWVESYKILPESQAGFRNGRSCADNIFTLMASTQIYLRHPKSRVYGIFVDFRKAFDSVDHQLLWNKM